MAAQHTKLPCALLLQIILPDVPACNSVIHVVDAVLVPQAALVSALHQLLCARLMRGILFSPSFSVCMTCQPTLKDMTCQPTLKDMTCQPTLKGGLDSLKLPMHQGKVEEN
jgi:hypothetical protein